MVTSRKAGSKLSMDFCILDVLHLQCWQPTPKREKRARAREQCWSHALQASRGAVSRRNSFPTVHQTVAQVAAASAVRLHAAAAAGEPAPASANPAADDPGPGPANPALEPLWATLEAAVSSVAAMAMV
jgi:hypothetical protein